MAKKISKVNELRTIPLQPTINPNQPPCEVAHPWRLRTISILIRIRIQFLFGWWEVVVIVIL